MPVTIHIPAERQISRLQQALHAARVSGVPSSAVAREAGVDRAYLCRVASGDFRPSLPRAERIACALGREVDDLFPPESIAEDDR